MEKGENCEMVKEGGKVGSRKMEVGRGKTEVRSRSLKFRV